MLIHEAKSFPGYLAALPVAGTVLLIGRSYHPSQLTERKLSASLVVSIGKLSTPSISGIGPSTALSTMACMPSRRGHELLSRQD